MGGGGGGGGGGGNPERFFSTFIVTISHIKAPIVRLPVRGEIWFPPPVMFLQAHNIQAIKEGVK